MLRFGKVTGPTGQEANTKQTESCPISSNLRGAHAAHSRIGEDKRQSDSAKLKFSTWLSRIDTSGLE